MYKKFKIAVKNGSMMEFIYENFHNMNEDEKQAILLDFAYSVSQEETAKQKLLQELSNHY